MKRSFVTSIVFAALASCTEQPPEPRTSAETSEIGNLNTTCGCDAVFPSVWNSGITDYWYGTANNMVLEFTGNADADPNTFLVFAFAGNGYQLAWAYKVNLSDYELFMSKWLHAYRIKQQSEPNVWIGGSGGLAGPGPGPVGPGGIPPGYIARLQRTAATGIDSTRIMNASVGMNGGVVVGTVAAGQ